MNNCNKKNCSNRHPRICKYFITNNFCKFGDQCAYSHKIATNKEIENIKTNIDIILTKIEKIEELLQLLDTSHHQNSMQVKEKANPSQFIPQLDGVNDSDIDTPHHENNSECDDANIDTDECKLCEEDFLMEEEFLNYFKLCRFMCNNCCDYYDTKPWFSMEDYTDYYITEGILLPQHLPPKP